MICKNYFFDLIKLFIVFNISYFFFISPDFSYIGLTSNFQLSHFFISIFLIFLYSFFLKITDYFLSDLFKSFFTVVSFLPSLTLFTFNAIDRWFIINWMVIFFFFLIIFNSRIYFKSINKLSFRLNSTAVYILLSITALIYIVVFGLSLNFQYFDLLSSSLYQGREELTQKMSSLGILRYFFANFQNVILPLFLAYGLIRKNLFISILSILFFIYVFLVTTFKSILLAPILIIGIFLFNNKYPLYLPNFILRQSYKPIVAACFIDYFLLFPLFNALIIRRIFFLPVLISDKYFEYFDENGYTYFSDLPFFEFFSIHPFSYSIPQIIGSYFIYNEGYMNAGFLADAFTKAGIVSVFLYIIVLKILISIAESNTKFENHFIIFAIIIIPLIALSNSSLTTTLFSHGLLLSLFVSSQIIKL